MYARVKDRLVLGLIGAVLALSCTPSRGGQLVGTNTIEGTLDGCAVLAIAATPLLLSRSIWSHARR